MMNCGPATNGSTVNFEMSSKNLPQEGHSGLKAGAEAPKVCQKLMEIKTCLECKLPDGCHYQEGLEKAWEAWRDECKNTG